MSPKRSLHADKKSDMDTVAYRFDARDARLVKSGGVALWTKADAATSFDDFIVKAE